MSELHDPDGLRLPIKLDATTNGEFAPVPLSRVHRDARARAFALATDHARRLGMTRRSFLVSASGAAATLLGFNAAFAAEGRRGGYYDLPAESALDVKLARSKLDTGEFVFDVQGHFVNPTGAWTKALPAGAQPLRFFAQNKSCPAVAQPGLDYLACLGSDAFVKDVFLDSDTDLVVLSFVPSTRAGEPLTIEEAAATAQIVERLAGTHRMLLHGRVNPNQAGDVDAMDMLAERHRVAAFKTYTQWGPDGTGFFLDDDIGLAFIEKARRLGVRNIAVHKGLPFGERSYQHSTCVDIGRVAKRFPDVNFLVYHSGFVTGRSEGPYDPARTDGIDALVTSVLANDVKPGGNVYAELGSPQDQIQAFRTFRIADTFVERYGYPQLTPALRAKVFGRNALRVYAVPDAVLKQHLPRDRVARERDNYRARRDPAFVTYGPRTRREFLALKARAGGNGL